MLWCIKTLQPEARMSFNTVLTKEKKSTGHGVDTTNGLGHDARQLAFQEVRWEVFPNLKNNSQTHYQIKGRHPCHKHVSDSVKEVKTHHRSHDQSVSEHDNQDDHCIEKHNAPFDLEIHLTRWTGSSVGITDICGQCLLSRHRWKYKRQL